MIDNLIYDKKNGLKMSSILKFMNFFRIFLNFLYFFSIYFWVNFYLKIKN